VASSRRWPIFVRPYGNQGLFAGTLILEDQSAGVAEAFRGRLYWSRPALAATPYANGFTGLIEARGSRYIAPAPGQPALSGVSWNISVGGGLLTKSMSVHAVLSGTNRFRIAEGSAASSSSVRITPATGLLRGSWKSGPNVIGRVRGAVLQSERSGSGLLSLPNGTDSLEITPAD